jgi:IS4 transposase
MNQGRTVFAQVIGHAPHKAFQRCVNRYPGMRRLRSFTCWDQFLCMVFAQLTYRESLRDIEACLGAVPDRLYHMGIRSKVSRSTLADANEKRDWRIYADFAQVLIHEARRLYAGDSFGDLRGSIPSFLRITAARTSDVSLLDELVPEAGAIYVMDRGYVDFARLYNFTLAQASFVVRAKKNLRFKRRYSREVDRSTGLLCDQTGVLVTARSAEGYPEPLRRVRSRDPETGKPITLLTNNFRLSAWEIAELYRCRWHVELFFKWIKQHLRIKAFYGTSDNAVRTQIWIAICAYVLVAILKKRLHSELSLYTILQILSVSLFEKIELSQAFSRAKLAMPEESTCNQLRLLDL